MTFLTKALLAVIAVLGLAVGIQTWRVHHAQQATKDAALANQNTAALHDTSRTPALSATEAARIFGDSLHAQERLAVQAGISRGELDRALNRQSQVIAGLTAQVAQLRSQTEGSVTGDTGVRVAVHHVREMPYTVDAVDSVPPAPGRARLSLAIDIDPARLSPRVQCGAPVLGVRPVTVLVSAPSWLRATVESAQADPGVCNPDLGKHERRLHAGVGYSLTLDRVTHRLADGPSLSLQWSVF